MATFLDRFDHAIARWMRRWGHPLHRLCLGTFFLWMGVLKVLGVPTGSSILAQTIYFGSPEKTVVALGAWEAAIGVCLLVPALTRVGRSHRT